MGAEALHRQKLRSLIFGHVINPCGIQTTWLIVHLIVLNTLFLCHFQQAAHFKATAGEVRLQHESKEGKKGSEAGCASGRRRKHGSGSAQPRWNNSNSSFITVLKSHLLLIVAHISGGKHTRAALSLIMCHPEVAATQTTPIKPAP